MKKLIIFLTGLFILAMPSGVLWACACCTEKGTWQELKVEFKNYPYLLNDLRFSKKSNLLYSDPDELKGSFFGQWYLKHNENDTFFKKEGNGWYVSIEENGIEQGRVFLQFPKDAVVFQVDLYDAKKDNGNGPLLYTEFRFEGKAMGQGVFAEDIGKNGRFKMVLQGKSNLCLEPPAFKHWHLEMTGPKRNLTFNGEFMKPSSYVMDFDQLIGKPVGKLVNDHWFKYESYDYVDEPPGKLRGCSFKFKNNERVTVYLSKLLHLKNFDEHRKWDFESFKKETISGIRVEKDGNVLLMAGKMPF